MSNDGNLLNAYNLTGYDMVVAITQDAINYQLSELFNQGVIAKTLQVHLVTSADPHVKAKTIDLNANLHDPPAITMIDGLENRRKVLFHLFLADGSVNSTDFSDPLNFTDWEYVFGVNLDQQPITSQEIQAHQGIDAASKTRLNQFDPDAFSIQHLFLDFDSADLAQYDSARTKCPLPDSWGGGDLTHPNNPNVAPALAIVQSALESHFNNLKGTNNPYILGFTVTNPQAPGQQVRATLDPSYSAFSTYYNKDDETLSTLNFLITTGGKSLPTAGAAGLFDVPWVTGAQADGRFCVYKGGFLGWLLQRMVAPLASATLPRDFDRIVSTTVTNWQFPASALTGKLQEGQGPQVSWDFSQVLPGTDLELPASSGVTPVTWNFSYDTTYHWTRPGAVDCGWPFGDKDMNFNFHDSRGAQINLANPSTDTAAVNVEGWYERDLWFDYKCSALDSAHMERDSRVAFQGPITLSGGANGQLGMQNGINLQAPQWTDRSNAEGKQNEDYFKQNQEMWDSYQTDSDSVLRLEFAQLGVMLSNVSSRFVFPGAQVFFFKSPQFDVAGNLLVDVTYKM